MKKFAALFCLCAAMAAPARAAREIVVYSLMPEKCVSTVAKAFTEDTGIAVHSARFSPGEALSRLAAEKADPRADVLIGGPADIYEAGVGEGVFEKYVPKDAETIPAAFRGRDGSWTAIGIVPLCFMTNGKFLEKNGMKAPESWADLLDPRYKNGLQMADTRTSRAAIERVFSLVKAMGEDGAFKYQKALRANVQMYTKSDAGGAMPVATGQCASGVFRVADALDIQRQGYPVVITYPKDGVTFGIEAVGLVKGAGHPEEAKAFIDWLTGRRFAEFLVAERAGCLPARADAGSATPVLNRDKINLIEADIAWKNANRERLVERWVNEVIK